MPPWCPESLSGVPQIAVDHVPYRSIVMAAVACPSSRWIWCAVWASTARSTTGGRASPPSQNTQQAVWAHERLRWIDQAGDSGERNGECRVGGGGGVQSGDVGVGQSYRSGPFPRDSGVGQIRSYGHVPRRVDHLRDPPEVTLRAWALAVGEQLYAGRGPAAPPPSCPGRRSG